MNEPQRTVTIIPAKPKEEQPAFKRQLRVAAYCRVSTEEEEQQSSYEAQCTHYTDKIMMNPEWTMAGIYADEGITGTSTKKRDDFNRMIRRCKAGKIDLILTKSISRFARNTLDTINYTRMLRAMGIGIYFEKENINTLDADSEMLITMLGAFAQAESESISRNVAWGKRQAIKEGKVFVNFNRLYGYYLKPDGTPAIDPQKALVVHFIYDRYLAGDSCRMIRDKLDEMGIPNPAGEPGWSVSTIQRILTNEKYCGDVLAQKTFKEGVIGGKTVKNTGQLPQVLIQNNHPAIISREQFCAVQEEMKRRSAMRSPTKEAVTGRGCYSAKYALSDRLVCGECGTLYRRCTWTARGKKRKVWRCVSRLEHNTKYCKNSPSMEEGALQEAIMAGINALMQPAEQTTQKIADSFFLEVTPHRSGTMTLGEVKRRIQELTDEFSTLLEAEEPDEQQEKRFQEIAQEMASLKEKQEEIASQLRNNIYAQERIQNLSKALPELNHQMTEWPEEMIRQTVHTVKVLSADRILIVMNDGAQIEQEVHSK